MCGFLGGVTQTAIPEAIVKAALHSINHRGPDHHGFTNDELVDNNVLLGHTRLSIIDLSSAGSQPFDSDCGRYSLIFNGEIYNYKELRSELSEEGCQFNTESDTEVLLKAFMNWGVKVLPKIIGMFSFVFLDRNAQKLTLVRDAFGIKPFFYSLEDKALLFSSELKPVLLLRQKKSAPDLQLAYDYLVHGDYDYGERTFVDGIKHLQPAHYFTYDLKKNQATSPVAWWKPDIINRTELSFEQAVKNLRSLFLDSVKLHLRSDVPLGVALSGGVDSSAVVSAVRYLDPELTLNTFSYVASDNKLSEEYWVDTLNKAMDATPHKVFADEEEMKKELHTMVCMQGEPFGSTSIYAQYRVFKLAKESGMTVTLDGQGADELLAGYSGYPGHRLLSLIESNNLLAAHCYAKKWARFPGRSYIMAWKYLGRIIFPDWLYASLRKRMGRDFEPNWLDTELLAQHGVSFKERRAPVRKENKGLRVKEALANALTGRGLPSLLRHGDRNSMSFSIESRVPFLTIPIAEFLLSLPEHYLISQDGVTKHIFREAMRGIVPDSHLDRKDKIGFATPESTWLLNMAETIRDWIDVAPEIPFIDKGVLLSDFDDIVAGKKAFDGKVWRWVNYIVWYNIFISEND